MQKTRRFPVQREPIVGSQHQSPVPGHTVSPRRSHRDRRGTLSLFLAHFDNPATELVCYRRTGLENHLLQLLSADRLTLNPHFREGLVVHRRKLFLIDVPGLQQPCYSFFRGFVSTGSFDKAAQSRHFLFESGYALFEFGDGCCHSLSGTSHKQNVSPPRHCQLNYNVRMVRRKSEFDHSTRPF